MNLKRTLKYIGGTVSVAILDKDKRPIKMLEADPADGYLGEKFADNLRLGIRIELPKNHQLIIFRVEKMGDDPKHCTVLTGRHASEETLHYGQTMKIRRARSGHAVPDLIRNCLWVLIPAAYGRFAIARVEIVAQDGKFFLSDEILYEGQCYRDWREVAVPRFTACPELHYNEWPSLVELLNSVFHETRLRRLTDYTQPEPPCASDLQPGHGRVIWWSPTAYGGFGCVATPQGNAQVHWTKIVSEERYKCFEPNTLVTVERLEPTGSDLNSGFAFTAIGVCEVKTDPLDDLLEAAAELSD